MEFFINCCSCRKKNEKEFFPLVISKKEKNKIYSHPSSSTPKIKNIKKIKLIEFEKKNIHFDNFKIL